MIGYDAGKKIKGKSLALSAAREMSLPVWSQMFKQPHRSGDSLP
jgi:hypothetical protein